MTKRRLSGIGGGAEIALMHVCVFLYEMASRQRCSTVRASLLGVNRRHGKFAIKPAEASKPSTLK